MQFALCRCKSTLNCTDSASLGEYRNLIRYVLFRGGGIDDRLAACTTRPVVVSICAPSRSYSRPVICSCGIPTCRCHPKTNFTRSQPPSGVHISMVILNLVMPPDAAERRKGNLRRPIHLPHRIGTFVCRCLLEGTVVAHGGYSNITIPISWDRCTSRTESR